MSKWIDKYRDEGKTTSSHIYTATQRNQGSDRCTSEGGGRQKLKQIDGDFPVCMRRENEDNENKTRRNEDLKGKGRGRLKLCNVDGDVSIVFAKLRRRKQRQQQQQQKKTAKTRW